MAQKEHQEKRVGVSHSAQVGHVQVGDAVLAINGIAVLHVALAPHLCSGPMGSEVCVCVCMCVYVCVCRVLKVKVGGRLVQYVVWWQMHVVRCLVVARLVA